MMARQWRVRLGAVAEVDFANILKWTTENFGARQAAIYRDTLVQAIGELANGPDVAGSRARNEIIPGLRTLHVARHGRRGRHFLLYRAVEGRIIEISRILPDQMDLKRYLPLRPGEDGVDQSELAARRRMEKKRRCSAQFLTRPSAVPNGAPYGNRTRVSAVKETLRYP